MKLNPTKREGLFLKAYLSGKSLADCARAMGSKGKDDHSLRQIGYETLTRLDISVKELHQMQGITSEYLRQKLDEGLAATKPYFATWQGKILQSDPVPDHTARLKALEIAHKLRGEFVDKVELTGKDAGDLILQLKPAEGKKGKKKSLTFE